MAKETVKNKREVIIETLKAGGATMAILTTAADCKYESVMSMFSTLRLMGVFPVKDVPGTEENAEGVEVEILTYRIADAEEWAKIKADRAENAKTKTTAVAKTPAEALEIAKKKHVRCVKANEAAAARLEKNESNEIIAWKAQIAALTLLVAVSELADAQKLSDENPEEVEVEGADEVEVEGADEVETDGTDTFE